MSNNKQQMVVEMMWNEIDNLFTFKDSVEAQKFCAILDKYKEMEKEQAIKFALCYAFGQYNVSEDLKTHIEKFYQQTYGGNK